MASTTRPEFTSSALHAAQVGIWTWSPDDGSEFLDVSLQRLLDGEDGNAESLLDRLTAEARDRLLIAAERSLAHGEVVDMKVALRDGAHAQRQFHLRGGLDPNDPRRLLVLCMPCPAPDCIQPASPARFPGAVEYFNRSCNGYFQVERTGRIVEANPTFCRLSGRTREELLCTELQQIFAPQLRPQVTQTLHELPLGACAEFELQVHGSQASPDWWSIVVLCADNGCIWGRATDITSRKRAEESLRRQRDLQGKLLDTAPVILLWLDLQGRIKHFNRYLETLTGRTIESVRGQNWVETFVPSNEQARVLELFQVAISTSRTRGSRNAILAAGGEERLIEWHDELLHDDEGRPFGLLAVGLDVTEAAKTETELQLKNAIVANMHAGALVVRMSDGLILYASRQFHELFGYVDGELNLQHVDVLSAGGCLAAAEKTEEIRQSVRATGAWRGELLNRRKDGTEFWSQAYIVRYCHPQFGVVGISVQEDTSQHKAQEAALRASERRLRQTIDACFGFIGLYDLDGTLVEANRAPLDAAGLTREEVIGQPFWETFWWSYSPDVQATLRDAMSRAAAGETVRYETPVRVRNDALITIDVSFGPLRDESGQIVGMVGFAVDISQRIATEQELRRNEERIRFLVQATPVVIYSLAISANWPTTYASDNVRMLTGYTAADFLADDLLWQHRVHPEDLPAALEGLGSLLDVGCASLEYRFRHANGEYRWMRDDIHVIRNASGAAVEAIGCWTNVTDRKLAELALKASERRLRLIVDSEPECVKLLDEACHILKMNPAGLALVGASSKDEVLGRNVLELIAAPYRDVYRKIIAKTFAGERTCLEYEVIGLRGERRFVEQHAVALPPLESSEDAAAVLAVTRDVTLRRQAEKLLHESNERLRILVENVPAGVAMLDRDLRYLAYSRRWLADYRLGEQDLHGRTHYEVFPEIPERWKEIHRRCMEQGVSEHCEEDEFPRADGTVDYLRWEIQPWFHEDGETGGLLFFTELTTPRVLAERALRESEEMLAYAQHLAKLGSWSWDIRTDTLRWSDEVFRIFGHAPQSFSPQYEAAFLQAIHPEDRNAIRALVEKTLREDTPYDAEFRIRRPDGSERIVRELARVVPDATGRPMRMFGTVQDMTEIRQAEAEMQSLQAQLARAARVAIVGEMGAGIAHELNQPLAALSLQVEECIFSLQHRDLKRGGLIARLESVARLSHRCGQIIHRLRSFSSQQPNDAVIIDLREIALSAMTFLEHDLRTHNQSWTVVHDDEPLWVLADAVQVQQIVINLVRNAMDAQPHGGRIEVAVRASVPGYSAVEVRDAGQGLSAEQQSRLFEPFFSTKPGGLGLGLKISRTIAESYKGEIRCHSKPGQGATFLLLLPRQPGPVEQTRRLVD